MAVKKIIVQQVGRNLNVSIGNLVITKTGIKEELDPIKKDIAKYNFIKDHKSKVAENLLNKIKSVMQAKSEKKIKDLEAENNKLKGEKNLVKKTITKQDRKKLVSEIKSTPKEVKELKKVVQTVKKEEPKIAPKQSHGYRGEGYR